MWLKCCGYGNQPAGDKKGLVDAEGPMEVAGLSGKTPSRPSRVPVGVNYPSYALEIDDGPRLARPFNHRRTQKSQLLELAKEASLKTWHGPFTQLGGCT